MRRVCWVIIASFLLSACDQLSNQEIGRLSGTVIGAVMGSTVGKGSGRAAAVVGGALIGGQIGEQLGIELDEANSLRMMHALDHTPLQQSHSWSTQGTYYTLTPKSESHQAGRVCRRYSMSVLMEGELKTVQGRACKDASGHWVNDSK